MKNIYIEGFKNMSEHNILHIKDTRTSTSIWSRFYREFIIKAMFSQMKKILKETPKKYNDVIHKIAHHKLIKYIQNYVDMIESELKEHLRYLMDEYNKNIEEYKEKKIFIDKEIDVVNYNFDMIDYNDFYLIEWDRRYSSIRKCYVYINIYELYIDIFQECLQDSLFIDALIYFGLYGFYILLFASDKITPEDATLIFNTTHLFYKNNLLYKNEYHFFIQYCTIQDESYQFIDDDEYLIEELKYLNYKFKNILIYSMEHNKNIIFE